eukprot:scaffold56132_cov69-Phaeocystis_antarctica.AAC.1
MACAPRFMDHLVFQHKSAVMRTEEVVVGWSAYSFSASLLASSSSWWLLSENESRTRRNLSSRTRPANLRRETAIGVARSSWIHAPAPSP